MSQDIFAVGDSVVWEDPSFLGCLQLKDELNVGPFTIVRTEDVPLDKCSCGQELDEFGECLGFCVMADKWKHQSLIESVGHPQWVWVETSDGDRQFSGAWFKKE